MLLLPSSYLVDLYQEACPRKANCIAHPWRSRLNFMFIETFAGFEGKFDGRLRQQGRDLCPSSLMKIDFSSNIRLRDIVPDRDISKQDFPVRNAAEHRRYSIACSRSKISETIKPAKQLHMGIPASSSATKRQTFQRVSHVDPAGFRGVDPQVVESTQSFTRVSSPSTVLENNSSAGTIRSGTC